MLVLDTHAGLACEPEARRRRCAPRSRLHRRDRRSRRTRRRNSNRPRVLIQMSWRDYDEPILVIRGSTLGTHRAPGESVLIVYFRKHRMGSRASTRLSAAFVCSSVAWGTGKVARTRLHRFELELDSTAHPSYLPPPCLVEQYYGTCQLRSIRKRRCLSNALYVTADRARGAYGKMVINLFVSSVTTLSLLA